MAEVISLEAGPPPQEQLRMSARCHAHLMASAISILEPKPPETIRFR